MIRSYLALKRELPQGTVLMMKIGRFYETFGEDAIVSSPILGIVLTSRGNMPACGFDEAHIDSFLAKFVRAGSRKRRNFPARWKARRRMRNEQQHVCS